MLISHRTQVTTEVNWTAISSAREEGGNECQRLNMNCSIVDGVPEDAEIGTDGEGLALLAILAQRSLVRDRYIQSGRTLCRAINQAMWNDYGGLSSRRETETGVIIVTFQGTYQVLRACSLKTSIRPSIQDYRSGGSVITEFANELHNPQILDCR